jgi:sugar-specific transcriptional regulator TrmB
VVAYHGRTAPEQKELQRVVDATVQHKRHQQETNQMSQTIAEALEEKGKLAGLAEGEVRSRQETLKMLLHERFRKVSPEVLTTIEQTSNPSQLDEWLRKVLKAKSVREVGIAKAARR